MEGVTIRSNDDGTVDLVVEGVSRAAALAMADQILAGGLPARARAALPASTSTGRRKAAKVECPICHRKVFPQGLVSHQRGHERRGEKAA